MDLVASGNACEYSDQCANATEFCRVGDLRCVTAAACSTANTADTTNRDCTAIARLNNAPTAVAVSSSTFVPPVTAAQAIGNLSTTDADSGQTFTYSMVGGADVARFSLASSQLRFAAASHAGGNLVVQVRTVDTGIPTRYFDQTLTISGESVLFPLCLPLEAPQSTLLTSSVCLPGPSVTSLSATFIIPAAGQLITLTGVNMPNTTADAASFVLATPKCYATTPPTGVTGVTISSAFTSATSMVLTMGAATAATGAYELCTRWSNVAPYVVVSAFAIG